MFSCIPTLNFAKTSENLEDGESMDNVYSYSDFDQTSLHHVKTIKTPVNSNLYRASEVYRSTACFVSASILAEKKEGAVAEKCTF